MMALQAPKLVVNLNRNTVTFEVTCADRYEAMELYDRTNADARNGRVLIDLATEAAGSAEGPQRPA